MAEPLLPEPDLHEYPMVEAGGLFVGEGIAFRETPPPRS